MPDGINSGFGTESDWIINDLDVMGRVIEREDSEKGRGFAGFSQAHILGCRLLPYGCLVCIAIPTPKIRDGQIIIERSIPEEEGECKDCPVRAFANKYTIPIIMGLVSHKLVNPNQRL